MNEVATRLHQAMLHKYRWCHVFVVPMGYMLQINSTNQYHTVTVPFDAKPESFDYYRKKLEEAYEGKGREQEQAEAKPKAAKRAPSKRGQAGKSGGVPSADDAGADASEGVSEGS